MRRPILRREKRTVCLHAFQTAKDERATHDSTQADSPFPTDLCHSPEDDRHIWIAMLECDDHGRTNLNLGASERNQRPCLSTFDIYFYSTRDLRICVVENHASVHAVPCHGFSLGSMAVARALLDRPDEIIPTPP